MERQPGLGHGFFLKEPCRRAAICYPEGLRGVQGRFDLRGGGMV